jgi:opine dehydrogenase
MSRQALTKMRVAIIGVGNIRCALAVDLESRNLGATLWAAPGHRRIFNQLCEQGYLNATEAITGRFHPKLSEDLDRVIKSTEIIIVAIPATGHDAILTELAKYNFSQHVIIFIYSNFFAPIAAARINAKAIISTSRSPYSTRTEEYDTGEVKIRVNGIKKRLEIASFEEVDQSTRDKLGQIFVIPLVWHPNTLQLDLSANHGVVHPPTMLSNIGPIMRKENLFFYRDCMTPEVCNLMLAADRERLGVAAALGFTGMETVVETFNADYGMEFSDLATLFEDIDVLNKRRGLPPNMRARQLSQDIPFWCVPVASLAKALGVETPIIDSWILSSTSINQTDYRKIGRTLEAFGLRDDALKQEILRAFKAITE